MILRVTNSTAETDVADFGFSAVYITPEDINDPGWAPFVFSKEWEAVVMDVVDSIIPNFTSLLAEKSIIIPIFISDTLNSKQVSLLCEMCFSKAAYLRSSMVRGEKALIATISSIAKERQWESLLAKYRYKYDCKWVMHDDEQLS